MHQFDNYCRHRKNVKEYVVTKNHNTCRKNEKLWKKNFGFDPHKAILNPPSTRRGIKNRILANYTC